MKNIFTSHPHSIGESYFQHLKFASLFGARMTIGGIACLLHAIFPFIFQKTGSNILLKMTHHFIDRMPTVENHIVDISRLIEKKRVNSSDFKA
jgi:Family of unknown function (DUF6356)